MSTIAMYGDLRSERLIATLLISGELIVSKYVALDQFARYMDLGSMNYCTCTHVYPSSHRGSALTLSNEIKLSSS